MRTKIRSKISLLFVAFAALLALPAIALASAVDVAVVDVTAPTGSVSLSPGGEGTITINMSVSGKQEGTATFEVYRDWTLSGGTFTGSNPQEFTVPARAATDAATTFSTTGKVSVAAGEPAGTKTLAVGAFDITNTNSTGAKLSAGTSSNYEVTVLSDPCASVSAPAAPVITATPNTEDGNGGWYKTVPTDVSATSATSGATIMYATEVNGGAKSDFSSTAPTLGQGTTVVYAKATSATCNKVSTSSRTFMVDSIAPVVDPANVVNNTWRNTDLSQAFTANDGTHGSGLADANDASFTLTASAESANASTPTVVSKTVSDVAGNSTTRSVSAKIDLTDPSLGNIVDNNAASSNVCTASGPPTQPTGFDPSDGLSGLNESQTGQTWTPPGTPPFGDYTYEAHATDNAGNTDSYGPRTYNYSVGIGQTGGPNFSGALQPINQDGTSRFKINSTIPVKFTLNCGSTPITDAVVKLTVKQGDSKADPGSDEAISTAASTTGNLFRYDATSGQYIFNLSTKSGYLNPGASQPTPFSAGTWTLGFNFADGTSRTQVIQLVSK